MNTHTTITRGLRVAVVLGMSLTACAAPRSPAVRAETYAFDDGAGSAAQVFRAVAADGSEALRGVTEIAGDDGLLRIDEQATLDPAGRLVRAEIVVSHGRGGAVEDHVVLDRARGVARAATPGGTVTWSVPNDAAWTLEPLARGAATPISAWITARAASAGGEVRVVQADRRTSYRTPADQLAIAHERGTTVVLGDASGESDGAFISDVRAPNGRLVRRGDAGAPLVCAAINGRAPDVIR
jgi:hypothetical protein